MILNNYTSEINKFKNTHQFSNELEKRFFTKIFSTSRDVYNSRIRQINFINKKNVLDAGCGYGQWTVSLCEFNENVYAIDLDPNKLKIAKKITNSQKNTPLFQVGNVENLPFDDNQFDAIFSYSVIYWTDYKKTLNEFFRVLKPSGKLYFVTNGFGWSLFNLFTGHSSASDFNARKHALKTIFETIKYTLTNNRKSGQSIFMSSKQIINYLKEIGFQKISFSEEGYLNFNKSIIFNSFYPKKFLGIANVFEIYAEK